MSDAGEVSIIALDRRDPRAWALMPAVLDRVRSFCERYQTDSTPEGLADRVMEHFAAADEACRLMRVLVALRDGELVGHCVISLDGFGGNVYATLVQYAM